MINLQKQQELVTEAMNQFPPLFGLRAFPGDTFRISKPSSYVNDSGQVMLYTEIFKGGEWQSFAKGTPEELKGELSADPNKRASVSLAETLAKTARVLCEDEQVNSDSNLQAIIGDPDDTRVSTFVQFQPNPGTMALPNPMSPVEGDEIFFAYMIPGAIFQAHDGSEWWILTYTAPDEIQIENRWYPRLNAIVSINDIRRSIHQWIEPVTQTVPPPPPGVDYGALPVKIVDGPERYGAGDELTDYHKTDLTGGW